MSDKDPRWVKKYYGDAYSTLKPVIFIDGKKAAVVRLTKDGTIGFVLIQKNGSHGASAYQSLFEGQPNKEDVDKMKSALEKIDGD